MSNKQPHTLYLDIASSTPVKKEVREAMEPYWSRVFANPFSRHSEGRRARTAIEATTAQMAGYIGARTDELVVTSGGTESNTLALRGTLERLEEQRGSLEGLHVLTSNIEHPSVADIIPLAEKRGMKVDIIPITSEGVIDMAELKNTLHPKTVLVSVMYVNSEIGTIQPIAGIARLLKKKKKEGFFEYREEVSAPIFHTDATQAPLWLPIQTAELGADIITLDAHKMYGPKGIGLLYLKRGVSLNPLFLGAEGKHTLRSGTLPTPLVVGFAEAFSHAEAMREGRNTRTRDIQLYFWNLLKNSIAGVGLNGSLERRVAGNVSITIPNTHHEFVRTALDERGVVCATRSACLESGGEGSYVIEALTGGTKQSQYTEIAARPDGVGIREKRNALRFTFDGLSISKKDIDMVVKELGEIIAGQKYM